MKWADLKDRDDRFGMIYVVPEHIVAVSEYVENGVKMTRVYLTSGKEFVMANPIDVVKKIIEQAFD